MRMIDGHELKSFRNLRASSHYLLGAFCKGKLMITVVERIPYDYTSSTSDGKVRFAPKFRGIFHNELKWYTYYTNEHKTVTPEMFDNLKAEKGWNKGQAFEYVLTGNAPNNTPEAIKPDVDTGWGKFQLKFTKARLADEQKEEYWE